jgi:hypothetical protein
MKLVNLTQKKVVIAKADGSYEVIPTSGTVARVKAELVPVGMVGDVPIMRTEYTATTGLPEPIDGVLYVVTPYVRLANPERDDLVSPIMLIRDINGDITACRGLELS